jgi:hypothetical protein
VRCRSLSVTALAVLCLGGATACQPHAGAAAFVDGHRVSDSDVSRYVRANAEPIGSDAPSQKSIVLQTLVIGQLLSRAIEQNGGPARDEELAAARAQLLPEGTDTDIKGFLVRNGFTASFEPVYLRGKVLVTVLAARVDAGQDGTRLVAALARLHPRVSVSARYGEWDATNFVISTGPRAGVPSFLIAPGAPAEED